MARGDLTDQEWAIIGSLLPSEPGRWVRPYEDNRRSLNGMLDVLRVGCPWRDMHERYGKGNSIYVRFRRYGLLPVTPSRKGPRAPQKTDWRR
ncbi:transposase [Gluconobacter thailandicus F149-1 = NBRC 100600]|uniref:transposase n=1 Tax=Gluconobacter thailandicus TaxID=257438 RepID=UPI0005E6247D|nr:transposase [Gluconobacter thailandicus]GAN92663.1 transposase [Gluconobacter thailandicus F149-1 = NBRC 100600]